MDERELVELIGMNLQRNGYEVLSAMMAPPAWTSPRKPTNPTCSSSTVLMPGLSGRDVTMGSSGENQENGGHPHSDADGQDGGDGHHRGAVDGGHDYTRKGLISRPP